MTQEIKLPPLPIPEATIQDFGDAYQESHMRAYGQQCARAAVEADRQQRGEPVNHPEDGLAMVDPASAQPVANQSLTTEREAFEEWAKRTSNRPGTHFGMSRNGVYKDNRVAAKWAAWIARANLDERPYANDDLQLSYVQACEERDHLRAALAQQPSGQDREDAERLDWLEQHNERFYNIDKIASIVGTGFLVSDGSPMPHRFDALRDAIDAARAAKERT